MMLSKLRLCVTLTIALLAASLAKAQQPTQIPRLCYLAPYPVAAFPVVAGETVYDTFLRGLRDLGYVEGTSLSIDYWSADGRIERFPTLASECLHRQADQVIQ